MNINNPDIDWRRILLSVAKRFDSLTGSRKDEELNEKSAVIIDDSALVKTGLCIEKLSYIFDHVLKKTLPGFKNLVLAHYDGISCKVLDTSLHSEKKIKRKHQRKQFKSSLDKTSPAFARRKELSPNWQMSGQVIYKPDCKPYHLLHLLQYTRISKEVRRLYYHRLLV